MPFDPSEVLDKLRASIETPPRSSPPSSQDPEHGWQPTTPRNISQLEKQARTITKSLKRKTIGSVSPTNQATVQITKVALHSMYAIRLQQERIQELEKTVERLTKRRRAKRTYVKNKTVLTAAELAEEEEEEAEEVDEDTIIINTTGTRRRCGRCYQPGHNSRTCSS